MTELARLEDRFRFDVGRLKDAAVRLDTVDRRLVSARRGLEDHAGWLSRLGTDVKKIELGDGGATQVLYAKAQAAAQLARKAALRDLLHTAVDGLAIVASMAMSRWLWALEGLGDKPHGEIALRAHVETGRVAHRVLQSFCRKLHTVDGLGQFTSALVVASFAHDEDQAYLEAQVLEGLSRARVARPGVEDELLFEDASAALREAASLLEMLAERTEPLVEDLVTEAGELEATVERQMRAD